MTIELGQLCLMAIYFVVAFGTLDKPHKLDVSCLGQIIIWHYFISAFTVGYNIWMYVNTKQLQKS